MAQTRELQNPASFRPEKGRKRLFMKRYITGFL